MIQAVGRSVSQSDQLNLLNELNSRNKDSKFSNGFGGQDHAEDAGIKDSNNNNLSNDDEDADRDLDNFLAFEDSKRAPSQQNFLGGLSDIKEDKSIDLQVRPLNIDQKTYVYSIHIKKGQ